MSYECQFCGKTFKREKTLAVHLCEQKRRWLNKDEKYVRLGFIAYKRFYEISMGDKKDKDYTHFSSSTYYTAFTRFGKYITEINAIDPEKFIDFAIKSSIPLDRWTKDVVYNTYIQDLSIKETAERALERTILLMQRWGEENDRPFHVFFGEISRPRAIHWIRSGRISPWVIFNCNSGIDLVSNFTDEEMKMVNDYMEPAFWTRKFEVRKADVKFVSDILEKAGL